AISLESSSIVFSCSATRISSTVRRSVVVIGASHGYRPLLLVLIASQWDPPREPAWLPSKLTTAPAFVESDRGRRRWHGEGRRARSFDQTIKNPKSGNSAWRKLQSS